MSNGPFYAKSSLSLNILRTNGQNFTKFYYGFIMSRSTLGLLYMIFRLFVPEVWPLIYAKKSFPFNILRQINRISPNFIYVFILSRFTLGLLHIIFRTFVPELWPFI